MIHDVMLRWVVTGLFALTAAECVVPIVIRRQRWTVVVSHGLHIAMSVAMAAMAWPWSTQLPATAAVVFFLLATTWYIAMAVIAARTTAGRMLYAYHGLMMLATAWMYASMDGPLLPVRSSTTPVTTMPDMDMAGATMATSGGSPAWFGAVNWLGTATFAIAAIFWTCRCVIERRHHPARLRSLGNVGQAMMASGMAILFLATLFRI
ncbi:DUF5134 domain-containing protein [Mycobacterium sp.]|uniref:DUF5134 domain-containing protein n=1 Tax=Mycobacterium sp. TaxID=1785 RepID=UPI0012279FAE|nr:DUF5134 domain-containing protein [Mycobacterium sp.]TAM71743.1 MAG: DUF5134 domain-containing protein [Mycobacterium sp.]